MRKIFLSLFLFFLAVPSVLATSTQQFNNIHLTPYYFSSFPADTNQTMYVNINPPDNIATVLSALFHFKAFTSGSTTTYTLYINNKLCGTFLVSTTYANSGQNEIAFDCTSLITKAGNYTVKLKSDRNAGSFFGWLDLTYMNNPIRMETSGTEYLPNDNGTVFVRLLDGNSNPINLASCNVTIYYPNKTKFISQLSFLEKGIYYHDFTVPSVFGIYITSFDCIFPSAIFYQNQTLFVSQLSFNSFFPFDDTDNVTINSAVLSVKGNGAGGDKWDVFFNGYLVGKGGNSTLSEFPIQSSYFSIADQQSYTLDATAGSVKVSWASLRVNYTANNPEQIIRGQNEIHVGSIAAVLNISAVNESLSGMIANIPTLVWSWGNRSLTEFSFAVNLTQNAFNLINSGVWNYVTRELTHYPPAVNITNITTVVNVSVTNQTVSVINQTVDLTNVTNAIENVSSKVDWWGNQLNTTQNYWGNTLYGRIDYWGNALETKMDNIIMGNVSVTALVDYDEIAITVLQYMRGVGIWK